MRILIVAYALHMGGMENHLLPLAGHLRARGHDVRFLVTAGVGAWHTRPGKMGIEISAILQRPLESKIKHAERVLHEMRGYDAVMLNHSAPARAVAGLVDPAIALVSMIHTDHRDDYPLALSVYGDIDRTICPSTRIYQTALARGTSPESLVLVPYGVSVSSNWPRRPDTFKSGRLYIAYVGRLVHEHKGVLNLPAIADRFAERYDGVFQLDVLGDGPDLVPLQRKIADRGLEEVINVVGALSHDDLLARLPRYDLLLMPSRYEGLPIVMLEAMAAGVVPIVSDLPGVTDEAVRHEVNGFLVPRDDVDAFAGALERATEPGVRSALSRAAWQTIRDRFDSERMLARHAEVFAEAVAERRNSMRMRSGISSYDLLGRGPRAPRLFIDAVKRGRKLRQAQDPKGEPR